MKTAKEEVREVLDLLPDDCSMEDIQYHLYVRDQIRQGLWSLEHERTYTQEEIEQSVARWLADEEPRPQDRWIVRGAMSQLSQSERRYAK